MSYTVSRNPDYIMLTFKTSPDLVAVDPVTRWIVQIISNKGTAVYLYQKAVPLWLRTDPTSQFYQKSTMITWLDTGGSLGYMNGTWSNIQGIEFTPLTPDSQEAVDFIHQFYPNTYSQWVKEGVIKPAQAVVSNVPMTPTAPLAPVLGDTPYYGPTTDLKPVSGSLTSQGLITQPIEQKPLDAPADAPTTVYVPPPVSADFQALKDAQASAPAGQTVTNVGVAYTATAPQGQVTNETTTATPQPQPAVQTPAPATPAPSTPSGAFYNAKDGEPLPQKIVDFARKNPVLVLFIVIVIGGIIVAVFGKTVKKESKIKA